MAGVAIPEPAFEFDRFFESHYGRIARVIARVVRDPARAEELAVDVFWKFWRTHPASLEAAGAWVYRAGVRAGLDRFRGVRTPEQLHAAAEEQEQVRAVLARLNARQAELLVLRADGLSYEELAATLRLSQASVGTLLTRAQKAFKKDYLRHYGKPRY